MINYDFIKPQDESKWFLAKSLAQTLEEHNEKTTFETIEEVKDAYIKALAYRESDERINEAKQYDKDIASSINLETLLNKIIKKIDKDFTIKKIQNSENYLDKTIFKNLSSENKNNHLKNLTEFTNKIKNNTLTKKEKSVIKEISLGIDIYSLKDGEIETNIAFGCPGCGIIYLGSPKFKDQKNPEQPCCGDISGVLKAFCRNNHRLYQISFSSHSETMYE